VRTLAELIRWRAQRHPDIDAIWYEGKTQTYGELDRSSSELAGGLVQQLGLMPGDRVAILDKNCPEYLELVFALDKAGVVAAPLNWRLTPREIKAIVDDIKPVLLVAGNDFKDLALGVKTLTYAELPRGGADPRRDVDGAVLHVGHYGAAKGRHADGRQPAQRWALPRP